MKRTVVVKGAGDLATGVAHRLVRSGFAVVMTELAQPLVIRRTVAFAQAIFCQQVTVEQITAIKTKFTGINSALNQGKVPVVVDPTAEIVKQLQPWAVVDAIMAKINVGTNINDAPVVVGLGPGFTAGKDVNLVVETMRGHYLGRVITEGQAIADTGVPGDIGGYNKERILRAPCAGIFIGHSKIGDLVNAGQVVAYVDHEPVIATISGVLRGLLNDGIAVPAGLKIGDIDPRCAPEHCFTISDKARAIGGGVLEALLFCQASQV
ncbi:selenium-dependent molybdenum cofactor biosynthesis protein YqeB [Peptococcaceae bacterium 1198_IL3148]